MCLLLFQRLLLFHAVGRWNCKTQDSRHIKHSPRLSCPGPSLYARLHWAHSWWQRAACPHCETKSHTIQSITVHANLSASDDNPAWMEIWQPHLQHELTVVPPHEDHLPGQAMARAPAAHQEPGSQTHLCLASSPLTLNASCWRQEQLDGSHPSVNNALIHTITSSCRREGGTLLYIITENKHLCACVICTVAMLGITRGHWHISVWRAANTKKVYKSETLRF